MDERLRQLLKDGDILDLAGCVDVGIHDYERGSKSGTLTQLGGLDVCHLRCAAANQCFHFAAIMLIILSCFVHEKRETMSRRRP